MSGNDELHELSSSALEHHQERPAMIRSEEVLRVATETVPYARARLQKVIVTERRTFTVDVRREEVRLTTEPLPAGSPVPAPVPGEHPEDIQIVLHEERVVVTTEIVPVERVRLVTFPVTGSMDITGDVRRDHIDLLTSGSTTQKDI